MKRRERLIRQALTWLSPETLGLICADTLAARMRAESPLSDREAEVALLVTKLAWQRLRATEGL
jgi:hypothetical protein